MFYQWTVNVTEASGSNDFNCSIISFQWCCGWFTKVRVTKTSAMIALLYYHLLIEVIPNLTLFGHQPKKILIMIHHRDVMNNVAGKLHHNNDAPAYARSVSHGTKFLHSRYASIMHARTRC